MITRLLSLLTLLGTLILSAIGVAFGADVEKHAFLGVMPGEVTSEIATEYGVHAGEGVLVEGISSDSPAEKIGLRENDIITSVNGGSITGPEEFRGKIAKMNPGDKVELTYVRGGKQKTVSVELSAREENSFGFLSPKMMNIPQPPRAPRPPREEMRKEVRERHEAHAPKAERVAFAGIVAQNLSEGLAKYFKVEKGALVSEVVEDSPADKAGLKAGDIITRIGKEDIEDEGDVREAIHDLKPGDKVDFVIMRDGNQQTISVTLGEQEMPDLGENSLDFDLHDLKGLEGMHFDGVNEEQMRELENKLKDIKIKIENLDSNDIHIEAWPDNPRIRIEKYLIGPVRYNDHRWQHSILMAKYRLMAGLDELKADFGRLRDQLVQFGNELFG